MKESSSQRVEQILQERNLKTEVIEFKELTRTAQEAATAIGCEIGRIAKTLIFKGKITGQPICIIASGLNRIDEKKVEQYIGEGIEKADAAYVLKETTFAIGGVAPIGFEFPIKPLIDEDLMGYKELWAAAGTPHAVFRLSPEDLLRITQGKIVHI